MISRAHRIISHHRQFNIGGISGRAIHLMLSLHKIPVFRLGKCWGLEDCDRSAETSYSEPGSWLLWPALKVWLMSCKSITKLFRLTGNEWFRVWKALSIPSLKTSIGHGELVATHERYFRIFIRVYIDWFDHPVSIRSGGTGMTDMPLSYLSVKSALSESVKLIASGRLDANADLLPLPPSASWP